MELDFDEPCFTCSEKANSIFHTQFYCQDCNPKFLKGYIKNEQSKKKKKRLKETMKSLNKKEEKKQSLIDRIDNKLNEYANKFLDGSF